MRLIGEFGAEPQRERAARRLEAFAAADASRRLGALKHLKEAIEDGRLKGLARGLAYQLVEQAGALDRRLAEARIRALSRHERRMLKGLGVRFGAFSLYLPSLLTAEARLIGAAYAELARPGWRPDATALTPLPHPAPPPEALSFRGLRAVGGLAAPIAELERLDALARAALPEGAGAVDLTPALLADLGWDLNEAEQILRALGFARLRKGEAAEGGLWRRRAAPSAATPAGTAVTPFAALAALSQAELGRRAAGATRQGPPPPRFRTRRFVTDDACRIDVWLWRARFFKTRSLAARIVEDGGVRLTRGGARSPVDKPSRTVRCGDVLAFAQGPRWLAVKVEALGQRRGPAPEARALYNVIEDPHGAGQVPSPRV